MEGLLRWKVVILNTLTVTCARPMVRWRIQSHHTQAVPFTPFNKCVLSVCCQWMNKISSKRKHWELCWLGVLFVIVGDFHYTCFCSNLDWKYIRTFDFHTCLKLLCGNFLFMLFNLATKIEFLLFMPWLSHCGTGTGVILEIKHGPCWSKDVHLHTGIEQNATV